MATRKILPEDYKNKGIRTKSNPLGLSVTEAQRAFDELSLDVVIPIFNENMEALSQVDNTSDLEKPLSKSAQAALGEKVDKAEGMGLSQNDYTDEDKAKLENKVDKIEGMGLSHNDYSDEEKARFDTKVDKVTGKGLSQNDYTNADKAKVKTISQKADKTNVLGKDNAEVYEPTTPYHPATKKYVDDKVVDIGAADMTQAIYDPNRKSCDIFAYADVAVKSLMESFDAIQSLYDPDGRRENIFTYADRKAEEEAALSADAVKVDLFPLFYGFESKTTVFNPDGSITETDTKTNAVKKTVFNSNGSITETLTDGAGTLTKTTTFNQDGSISEVVS